MKKLLLILILTICYTYIFATKFEYIPNDFATYNYCFTCEKCNKRFYVYSIDDECLYLEAYTEVTHICKGCQDKIDQHTNMICAIIFISGIGILTLWFCWYVMGLDDKIKNTYKNIRWKIKKFSI